METGEVDVAKVLEVMEQVVEDFGASHVYHNPMRWTYQSGKQPASACRYVHGSVPGCLVGQVLHRLGVPLQVMAYQEIVTGVGVEELVRLAGDSLGIRITQDAVDTLAEAQNSQDAGNPWGQALQVAREYAQRLV